MNLNIIQDSEVSVVENEGVEISEIQIAKSLAIGSPSVSHPIKIILSNYIK